MQSSETFRLNKVRFVELVVLLGLLGAGLYAMLNPGGQATPAPSQPAIVDASFPKLSAEFTANGVAFQQKYADKVFRLTDTVVSINAGDPPNVVFAGGGQDPYDAVFDSSATSALAKLRPGDAATFTCTSMDIASQIGGCRIAR